MKKLIKKGLVEGCGCGCRGDYELSEKGADQLANDSSSGEQQVSAMVEKIKKENL